MYIFIYTYYRIYLERILYVIKRLYRVTDGDKDKEDIRRWAIGTDDAGGRQKLFRAVRSGE